MSEVSEMTTDSPRSERETERPRWRMKQPTKDQLRQRIEQLEMDLLHVRASWEATTRENDRLRRAVSYGIGVAAVGCLAGLVIGAVPWFLAPRFLVG